MANIGWYMVTEFPPNEGNIRILRDAFSRFVSGVSAVTAASNEGPVSITANSFSSLSLDPPTCSLVTIYWITPFRVFRKCTEFRNPYSVGRSRISLPRFC